MYHNALLFSVISLQATAFVSGGLSVLCQTSYMHEIRRVNSIRIFKVEINHICHMHIMTHGNFFPFINAIKLFKRNVKSQ